jgi:N-glycosylase/DNA lyase
MMLFPMHPNRSASRSLPLAVSPPAGGLSRLLLPVEEYDLDATLASGQAFRWENLQGAWVGVIGRNWVRLRSSNGSILAETVGAGADWTELKRYLQVDVALARVLATFPDDEPLRAAVKACHGLRLLRQDPWECLASFILSSTKQIIQIRQIVGQLCERFGEPVPVPAGHRPAHRFPTPERLARCSEAELRECKMGFRAPYLLATARRIAGGRPGLAALGRVSMDEARAALLELPGVGRKIADCVLLFGYGFATAFPVDVWVLRALRTLYFPRRRVSPGRLRRFSETHFGPHAGYAQQYLFHYMRTRPLWEAAAHPHETRRVRAEAAPADGEPLAAGESGEPCRAARKGRRFRAGFSQRPP